MNTKFSTRTIAALAVITFTLTSCKKDDNDSTPVADYSQHISNGTNEVIIKTYANLNSLAAILETSLVTLEANQTPTNLESAKQAWRDARKPWEQSEGFLFGPVDQQGLDPAMDSWPVNVIDLNGVLNNGTPLTKAYIDGLDGTLKGFHTIEYLLWGTNSNKQIADFTAREFEYLTACAQSLKGATSQLYNAWISSGGNFGSNLLTAGAGNQVYPSQKAVLQEFVNGMVTIADEVANGKINDPLAQQDVELEESRFSANSKADFADNIRSIFNIYTGSITGANAQSVSTIMQEKNAALDSKVRSQIADAISAIENIPGTFTAAITANPQSVQNAQNKVRDLLTTLQGDLLNAVNNL
ncbi:MAG: imelysin [Bacteroidetes bacterium]|nr:imelysin [Bacteroidota bacterium]HNR20969.1 imelysin family protein [Bacteroidia bacterium]HNU32817.1 imelysin family protein [Bacteroidia bacterium]